MSGLSDPPFATTSRVLAALGSLTALLGLFFALDPIKALVVVVGTIVTFVSITVPMVGLWINLFANTSLQVLGSSHITGAPASLSKIFGAISVVALILHMVFAGWKMTASPLFRIFAIFLIPVIGWDLVATQTEVAFLDGTTRFLLMVLLVVLIGTIGGQSHRHLDLLVIGFFAAMAICGLIALAEHYLPSLAFESDDPRLTEGSIGAVIDRESADGVALKRVTGGLGDANWLAYSVAISLPLMVYGWHRWPGFWMRVCFSLLGALQMIALVYSLTRTGFLGLAAASAFLIAKGVVPLRPALAIITLAFGFALVALPQGFVDRMFSAKYLKEGSTPIREFFVTEAALIFLEKPLLGHGYRMFGAKFFERLQTDLPEDLRLTAWANDTINAVEEGRELVSNIGAHNLQLELLVEYGVIGALIFFYIFVVAWREAGKIEATGPPALRFLAIAIKAGLIAFLVCGLLGHAKYLKVLWILLGILVAARRVSVLAASGNSDVPKNLLDWQRS